MTANTTTLGSPRTTDSDTLLQAERGALRPESVFHDAENMDVTKLRHILCPVDICDTEQPALQRALRMAQGQSASVHVVYVYQTPFWFVQDLSAIMAREIDRVLARELAKAAGDTVSLQRHVVEGQPFEQIVDVAKRVGADVIVARKSGHSSPTLPWKSTIADRLVEQRSIPVIAVSQAA